MSATLSYGAWMLVFALTAASLVAVAANSLAIFIMIRRPGLRTVSNRFIINLLTANVLSSIVLIPLLVTDEIFKETFQVNNTTTIENFDLETGSNGTTENLTSLCSNTVFCYLAEGCASLICTASILSILLIAIDQFLAVVHPLRYHNRIDHCNSIILIASSWLVALMFSVFGAISPNKNDSLWSFCKTSSRNETIGDGSLRTLYSVLYFLCVILTPFASICALYIAIYTAAHKNSERVRHNNKSNPITINIEHVESVKEPINDFRLKVDDFESATNSEVDSIMMQTTGASLHSLFKAHNWNDATSDSVKRVKSTPNFNEHHLEINDTCPVVRKSNSVENVLSASSSSSLVANLRKLSIFRNKSFESVVPITSTSHPRTADSSKSNFMCSFRRRISHASIFRYREETRAAKISTIVIVMVLVCYIPYGIALILHTIFASSQISSYFDSIALTHLILSSVLSPFLFAYRNRRIKRELYKIIHPLDFGKLGIVKNKRHHYSTLQMFCKNTMLASKSLKKAPVNTHVNCHQLTPFLLSNNMTNATLLDIAEETKTGPSQSSLLTQVNHQNDNFLNVDSRSSFSSQNSTQISSVSSEDI